LGFPAAAKSWHGAGDERAQFEVTLLARLAQSRVALSLTGNVILWAEQSGERDYRPTT